MKPQRAELRVSVGNDRYQTTHPKEAMVRTSTHLHSNGLKGATSPDSSLISLNSPVNKARSPVSVLFSICLK